MNSYITLQTIKHENTLKILEFINIYRLRDGPVMVIFRIKNCVGTQNNSIILTLNLVSKVFHSIFGGKQTKCTCFIIVQYLKLSKIVSCEQ